MNADIPDVRMKKTADPLMTGVLGAVPKPTSNTKPASKPTSTPKPIQPIAIPTPTPAKANVTEPKPPVQTEPAKAEDESALSEELVKRIFDF